MIANLAWLAEGLLESAGAYFFFRRHFATLWIWLGFRAAADLVSFLALTFLGPHAYAWCDYIQRTVQYALVAAVSTWTAGMVLREHPKARRLYTLALPCLAAYAIVVFHGLRPLTAGKVLSFELWAELVLAGFVAAAMGVANGKPPKPWGLISCGLVILAGSDLVVTVARRLGHDWREWYPLGAIAALGVLLWAGWKDYELEEFRPEIPKKFQPTSVSLPQMRSRMIN